MSAAASRVCTMLRSVMSKAVAKEQDRITATDTHIVLVSSPSGPVPTPTPLPFDGVLDGDLSADVYAEHKKVALDGTTGTNTPSHNAPNGPFQNPPSNKGTVQATTGTVFANKRPLARADDPALTCNDPADVPVGTVVASGSVYAGS
jgi:hypothetical protein